MDFYPSLKRYVESLLPELPSISSDRKELLDRLLTYIAQKHQADLPVRLNFICTHNSRRSHMSQVWAATAAAYFGLEGIHCYSGGTEATAFNPRAVAALERAGFRITDPGGNNPHYLVRFSQNATPLECFSKRYDEAINPRADFAAVMTCTDADANCPFIPGATRLSLPYEDPKSADGTPEESMRYDERVRQIGRELFYVMAEVHAGHA